MNATHTAHVGHVVRTTHATQADQAANVPLPAEIEIKSALWHISF